MDEFFSEYSYVGNDPLHMIDPWGLEETQPRYDNGSYWWKDNGDGTRSKTPNKNSGSGSSSNSGDTPRLATVEYFSKTLANMVLETPENKILAEIEADFALKDLATNTATSIDYADLTGLVDDVALNGIKNNGTMGFGNSSIFSKVYGSQASGYSTWSSASLTKKAMAQGLNMARFAKPVLKIGGPVLGTALTKYEYETLMEQGKEAEAKAAWWGWGGGVVGGFFTGVAIAGLASNPPGWVVLVVGGGGGFLTGYAVKNEARVQYQYDIDTEDARWK